MKRETLATADWDTSLYFYDRKPDKRINKEKVNIKRRCRHRMKQQLNKELREYM